jgi:hypothetical protein
MMQFGAERACPRCGWQVGERVGPGAVWWSCPKCRSTGPSPRPNYCPTCGWELARPYDEEAERRGQDPDRGARIVAQVILLVIVLVVLLLVLNDLETGFWVKCHILGDWEACLRGG